MIGFGDLAGGLKSIHLRHGEIHDQHVGGELLCLGHRIPPVRGLSADLPARMYLQDSAQLLTNRGVVIGD